jgi:hypothetical protein
MAFSFCLYLQIMVFSCNIHLQIVVLIFYMHFQLTVFSFCTHLYFHIVAWRWPVFRIQTICHVIELLQNVCWVCLQISLDILTNIISHFPSVRLTYKTSRRQTTKVYVLCDARLWTKGKIPNTLHKYDEWNLIF